MVRAATYLELDPFFKNDYLLLQVLFAACRRSLADNCVLRGMEEEAGIRHCAVLYLVTDLRVLKIQPNRGLAYDQIFTHRSIETRYSTQIERGTTYKMPVRVVMNNLFHVI